MAAGSRKEEERNERVVRGLLKLPPNRRCVNCNGLGPQYVCTSFWTFVCISCSGIHREFTHRVKSVSLSTFTTQEVEALQKGGNQRARELFFKDFDAQKMKLPESSNVNSLREFIRAVYVERRYAGGRFSERPPRDKQNQKAHEEEHRRANSYHSFSQSPPADYQYEERQKGKLSAFLSRKPGSERGYGEKISVLAYSPHSLHKRMSEDGFATESCGSRTSNCSGSSMSDASRTAPQSPNFLDNGCFNSPVHQDQSNAHVSWASPDSQMGMVSVSAETVESISTKSSKSNSSDLSFEDDSVHRTQKSMNPTPPSFIAVTAANRDSAKPTATQQHHVNSFDQAMDLFADITPGTISADKIICAPAMDNNGWVTFDTPPQEKEASVTGFFGVADTGKDKQDVGHDLFSFEPNDQPTWSQISKDNNGSVTNQSSATCLGTRSCQTWTIHGASSGNSQATFLGNLSSTTSESQKPKKSVDDQNSYQLWHSFDDVDGVVAHDPLSEQLQCVEGKNIVTIPPSTSNPFACSLASKGGAFTEQVTSNPFDVDSGTPDLFMELNSLQEALPNPDLPGFLDGLPESWFSNSSCGYVSTPTHEGLPCLIEQAPNSPLRNITVSTGNPFA